MLRVLTPLFLIFLFITYTEFLDGKAEPVDNYPYWLKDAAGLYTDQTSGISYLGIKDTHKVFLTCDDVGKISRISIREDIYPPDIRIQNIELSEQVRSFLAPYKKLDFEEIYADKGNNKIYLSIEGFAFDKNNPLQFKDYEGIFELSVNKGLMEFDSILTISKLHLPPVVFEHTGDNIGFEGLGVTDKHFFIGLENFQQVPGEFSDSTFIYVYDRSSGDVKTVSTSAAGIGTICGLYAVNDYEVYGIDRNARRMFYILFKPDYSIEKADLIEMDLEIPNHPDINKILGTSPESITMDDAGKIYSVVDPWKDFYKPDLQEKKQLSVQELENFSKFIPIIYKFNNPFK
jgi:hypothetical protein